MAMKFGSSKDMIFSMGAMLDAVLDHNYILRDGKPSKARSVDELISFYRESMETPDIRIIAKSYLEHPEGFNIEVSSVFLGIDHNFYGTGHPVLYETMVFGGGGEYNFSDNDEFTRRYTHAEDAAAGHEQTVEEVIQLFMQHGFSKEDWTVLTQEGKAHPVAYKAFYV